MKTTPTTTQKILAALTLLVALTICATNVQAADRFKANNTTALNSTGSWSATSGGATGASVPGSSDRGIWDVTDTSSATPVSLGAAMTWQGLEILGPSAIPNVTGAFTLTLSGSSQTANIDMSSATSDFTMFNGLTLSGTGSGSTLNIASGHILNLNGGFVTANNFSFIKSGLGSVIMNGTNAISVSSGSTFQIANGGVTIGTNYLGTGGTSNNAVLNMTSGTPIAIGNVSAQTGALTNNGAFNENQNASMDIGQNGGTGFLVNNLGAVYTNTFSSGSAMNIGDSTSTGTLLINGGNATITGGNINVGNGGTGTLRMNGGVLTYATLTYGSGTGTAFFNGGTLQPGSSSAAFNNASLNAYISAGGLTVSDPLGTTAGYAIGQILKADTVTPSAGGGFTLLGQMPSTGAGLPGELTLNPSSAETYTGPTVVNGGNLILSYANIASGSYGSGVINAGGAGSAYLAFGSNYLGAGSLNIKGQSSAAAATQTFAGLNVWGGAGQVSNSLNTATTSTIALGAITRPSAANGVNIGGVVDFLGCGVTNSGTGKLFITTTTGNNANGILGGWATVSNTDFAMVDSAGDIVPVGTAGYATFPAAGPGSTTANYNITASGSTLSGNVVANSVRIQGGTLTMNSGGNRTLTLNGDTGGILLSGSATITGSSSTPISVPAGKELIVDCGYTASIQAASTLTAQNGVIGGTANINVTKTGPGSWNFATSGQALGFTGSLLVHQGIVSGNCSTWGPTNTMVDSGASIQFSSGAPTFSGSVGGNGSILNNGFTLGASCTVYPGGVGAPGTFYLGALPNGTGNGFTVASGCKFVFDLSNDPANTNKNDRIESMYASGNPTFPSTLNITINELNGVLGAGTYLLWDISAVNGGFNSQPTVSPTWIGVTPPSFNFQYVSRNGKANGALILNVFNPGTACTTPGTPTIGTTTVGCSQLTATWTAVSGNGNTYNIWRSSDAGATYTLLATAQSGTSYLDANASTNSTSYIYEVAATNVACVLMGPQSSASTSASPNSTPTVPTMNASTVGCSQLTVNWNAATGGSGITYAIARSTGGAYTQIATNQSGTSFVDTGANNSGSTYTYEVSAINSSGCLSGYSSPSSGQSPAATPTAPGGVSAAAGNTTATVSWTTVGGLTYNVYRTAANGSPGSETLLQTAATEPFTDTGLTDGSIYYYEVTAVNGTSCESAKSTEVNATPNPSYSGYTITVSGSGTSTQTAGGGFTATITAVDSTGAPVTGVSGTIGLTFGGLANSPSGQAPTFTGLSTFSSGVATVTITGYNAAASASVTATDGTHSTSSTGGAPLVLTINPTSDSAYRISAATLTPAAGAGDALTIKLVDQYQNVDTGFSGNKTLNFTGLSAGPDGSAPTVTDNVGTPQPFNSLDTAITFTSGVSTVGGSLVAHKAESSKLIAATDGTLSTTTTGGTAPTLSPTFGTASNLGVTQQPSTPDSAGSAFGTQPKVGVFDTYSNAVTTSTASISASAAVGTLLGTTSVNAVNGTGVASFTNLQLNNAGTNTITFSATGLGSTNSIQITVNGGAAVALAWTTAPGNGTTGSPLTTQPVLKTVDAFGNPSIAGLPTNQTVTVSLQGSGTLSGTTNYNIGSQGSNGVVTFTDLTVTGGSGSENLTASTVPLAVQQIATNATVWLDAVAQSSLSFSAAATVNHWNNLGRLGGQLGVPQYTDSGTFTGPVNTNNIFSGKPGLRFTANGGAFNAGGSALTNGWPAGSLDTGSNITVFVVAREPGNPLGDWNGYISFSQPNVTAGKDNRTLDEDADNATGEAPGTALVNRYFRNDNQSSPASGASGQTGGGQALSGSWLDKRPANGNSFVDTFYFTNNPATGNIPASGWGAGANYWVDNGGNVASNYQSVNIAYGAFGINEIGLGGQLGCGGSCAGGNADHMDWPISMDIAEVMVFSNVLSSADQGTIYAYLQNKWLNNSGVNWYAPVYSNAVSTAFTEINMITPTFSALTASQSITYGTSSISLSGTLSAPGPHYPANGETITATINGNAVNGVVSGGAGGFTINYNNLAGAGVSGSPYTITYSYAGDALLTSTNDVSTTLTVTPKSLAYTGVSVPSSKPYDGTTTASPTGTPTLGTAEAFGTGSTSDGLPYTGDSVSISGLPTAAYNSPDVDTATTVTFSLGSLALSGAQSADYGITVQGTQAATIMPATLSMSVVSSENPSGYKDSITFTATESAQAGSIIFKTNGVVFDTEALASGTATSAATTALPRGDTPVTATYSGNDDYAGTAFLSGGPDAGDQTVTNHPPTALNPAFYNRVQNLSLKILISDLLTNYADVDGDTLALTSYDTTTTNGTALFDDTTYIYYTNSTPVNVNDAFGYSVNDGFGGVTTNEVFISIIQTNGQQTPQITVGGSSVSVTFFGVPGYVYDVERNTNLGAGAGWVDITNVTTPAGGAFTITDWFNDIGSPPASAYYRLLVP